LMKLYALIHPIGERWGFDLFVEKETLDFLRGCKPPSLPYGYRTATCSHVHDWRVKYPNRRYIESGDTAQVDTVLNEWGLESEEDLVGLRKMLIAKGFTIKEAEA